MHKMQNDFWNNNAWQSSHTVSTNKQVLPTTFPYFLIMKHRVCLLAVCLLTVSASCSRIKFVYNQLDWLLPVYAESQIDLSKHQSLYLREQTEGLLQWHCRTQLNLYANYLVDINQTINSEGIKRGDIDQFANQIELFWRNLVKQVAPAMTELLLSLDKKQISRLFSRLEERHQEQLAELRELEVEEIRLTYHDRMLEEVEHWLGPLQVQQQQRLREWSMRMKPLKQESLANRLRWRESLRELLEDRQAPRFLLSGLHDHLINFRKFRTLSYQAGIDHNRKATLELLYQLASRLNQTQKRHIDDRTKAYARDFTELAAECGSSPGIANNVPL